MLSRKLTVHIMRITGVSKGPGGREGGQSLGGPPFVMHRFPYLSLSLGHLHVSFPSRHHSSFPGLACSGQFPPQWARALSALFVATHSRPLLLPCPVALPPSLPGEAILSAICPPAGHFWLFPQVLDAPVLAFLLHSHSQGTSLSMATLRQQPHRELLVLFCPQEHTLLLN